MSAAWPMFRRLERHLARLAASRAADSAGMSRDIRMAMMPITTRSSMRVKARLPFVVQASRLLNGDRSSELVNRSVATSPTQDRHRAHRDTEHTERKEEKEGKDFSALLSGPPLCALCLRVLWVGLPGRPRQEG